VLQALDRLAATVPWNPACVPIGLSASGGLVNCQLAILPLLHPLLPSIKQVTGGQNCMMLILLFFALQYMKFLKLILTYLPLGPEGELQLQIQKYSNVASLRSLTFERMVT
jgi:hypothetical protein